MTTQSSWLVYNGGLYTEKFKDYETLMVQAAADLGIRMHPVANETLLTAADGILQVPEYLPEPDFISFADKDLFLAEALEKQGYRLYNSARAIALCDDKRLMHRAFAEAGIPQPQTIFAPMAYANVGRDNLDYLKVIKEKLGLPLIIKEAFGSFGEQVYWIDSEAALEEKARKLQGVPHLYQKVVADSYGKDVRLNVVGNQVAASMKRTSASDFRANVTAGGTTEPYIPSEAQKETAIAAARAVGADMAGVDLFLNEGTPIVCEINSNPHVRSVLECTGVHVENIMMKYMRQGGRHL